jgi:hypothetical protein
MTLVVDPALSVRDLWPTTSGATLKTILPHWSAYMWKWCRTQAGRDLIIIHMPNINTITEPPTFNSRPTRSATFQFGRAAP